MSSNTYVNPFSKYAPRALLIAIVALSVAGWGFYQGLEAGDSRPIVSWLFGFSIWFSMGIGMLMLMLFFYLFGAGWPVIIRRQLEHTVAAFPYLGLVFTPLLLVAWFYHQDPGILWTWMNPDAILPNGHTVAGDVLYQSKSAYLNLPFFTVRVVLYFAVLWGVSFLLKKLSFKLDEDRDEKWVSLARKLAAGGLPLVGLSLTFAAFDFFMSISYHWFSTMYGVWFFATSMRAGIAGTLVLCALMARKGGPIANTYNPRHRYQLSCMALAFTVFWAYICFSQYFIIYNANVPEETFWYNMRELNFDGSNNAWWWVGLSLIFGYFLLPFLYLLFYNNKLSDIRIMPICIWILGFHLIDMYYNMVPSKINANNIQGYVTQNFSVTLYDISAYIGVGALCVWAFLRSSRNAHPIPIHDPFIKESIQSHHD